MGNKGEGRLKKIKSISPACVTRRMTVLFTVTLEEKQVSKSQDKFILGHAELKL